MQTTKKIFRFKKIALIVGAIILLWIIIRVFFTTPLLNDVSFSRAYFDRNRKLLRITLSADDKYRIYTPSSEISPHIKNAIILYEDKHFYHHLGINPISLFRATRQYISGAPHPVGASTITMQVARLKYDINTKSALGKLTQIAAAIYIELFHSKDEILTAYLNLAPYGGNIEGIGAASQIYFGKTASNLSKIEAITLATIPQNPTKRGLNTTTGLNNISGMRTDLVRRWIDNYPTDTNLIQLAQMPLHVGGTNNLPFLAPHFIDYLNTKQISDSIINTTLDLKLQEKLEKTMRTEIAHRREFGINNAAAILVNYKTMQVLSYIGSADYFNRDIYGENDGVRARRSPGSTLKPLIYAAATDAGLIHPMTLLKDTRVNFGVYAPENADNEFYGPVLARDALTHSRNIPAINLVREFGIKKFYKLLSDSGVSNLKSPAHYGVSIALGGAEVSMFELARIYTTMANLGENKELQTTITQKEGTNPNRLLSPEAYFLTLDMLAHQSTPTTKIPFAKNTTPTIRHYWKTGTSSSYRDAWTAGIFGDFVLIVWVGNFDGTPNNAFSGARAAVPIYFAMADTVINHYTAYGTRVQNNSFWTPKLNVIKVDMCAIGGGIAGTHCPQKEQSYFIPGKSPITKNTVHRMIPIDNATGLRACTRDSTTTHMELYEFWDAEYLDMFRRAGIRRKTAPSFMPGCEIEDTSTENAGPIMVSPTPATKIVITSGKNYEPVAFMGLADGANTKIFWFLDDKTLGHTKSGEVMKYNVQIGEHKLRMTDDTGNGTETTLTVSGQI